MKFCANEILEGGLARLNRVSLNLASAIPSAKFAPDYNLTAEFAHVIRSHPQNFARRFAKYAA